MLNLFMLSERSLNQDVDYLQFIKTSKKKNVMSIGKWVGPHSMVIKLQGVSKLVVVKSQVYCINNQNKLKTQHI